MRGAIVKIFTLTISFALCLVSVLRAAGQAQAGQVHGRFEGWCSSLQNATAPELADFLNTVVPDEKNGRCVTWAIHRLGEDRYEAAIPALVKLLGFRRPETKTEMVFRGLSEERFPAEAALAQIGEKALPKIVTSIEEDSTSTVARDNALFVYMGINKYDRPRAIARLKHEETKSDDNAVRQRLAWAIQKALMFCTASERVACGQAATGQPQ